MEWLSAFGHELISMYWIFSWFVSMALGNLLHPVMIAAPLVPILMGAIPYIFTRKAPPFTRDSFAVMPLIWTAIGLWGAVFKDPWPDFRWPDYVSYPLPLLGLSFLIFGRYALYKNRNYRVLTAVLLMPNLYFTGVLMLIAAMSISGAWL